MFLKTCKVGRGLMSMRIPMSCVLNSLLHLRIRHAKAPVKHSELTEKSKIKDKMEKRASSPSRRMC